MNKKNVALLCQMLVLAVALLFGQPAMAADDYKGTDFWVMFIRNYSGAPNLSLFISGDSATTGMVEIASLGFTAPFTVTPGTVTTVVIPSAAQVTQVDGTVANGIHVTADAEVFLYGLNRIQYTTDAFLGLPTDILSTEYLVMSYGGGSSAEFGVVAVEDATEVSITLPADAGGHTGGTPYTVTLDQGDTYQFQTGAVDLTGTVVTSDHPVAVFGGNVCVNIPPGFSACDHIVEEMIPTQA